MGMQSYIYQWTQTQNMHSHVKNKKINNKKNQTIQFKKNEQKIWIDIPQGYIQAGIPILWPPDKKSWLTGKDSDAGKDWRQEEKGVTEDEMVGWCHRVKGHEFG